MRYRLIAIIVPLLCMGMIVLPAHAASYRDASTHSMTTIHSNLASIGPVQFCNGGSAHLCLRDPSDGGAGTDVRMTQFTSTPDNARLWYKTPAFVCNGEDVVNNGCPNGQLDKHYDGDLIFTLQNVGSLYCIGANPATHFIVEMKTCGDKDTLFIQSKSCPNGYCFIISVDDSVVDGTIGWLCGENTVDLRPTVNSNCGTTGLPTWASF